MKKFLKIILALVLLAIVTFTVDHFAFEGKLFGNIMDLAMHTVDIKRTDYAKEQAAFTVTSEALSTEFKTNKDAANAKYINKAILLNGKITDIQAPIISLGNIACTLDSTQAAKAATLKVGDEVKIQGQFVGYNDLLDELDFSQCGIK